MATVPLPMTVDDIARIAVIGAGLMGHGIAQEFAVAGYEVELHDQSTERLQQALVRMDTNLDVLVELGMIDRDQVGPARSRIRTTSSLRDAVTNAQLVV